MANAALRLASDERTEPSESRHDVLQIQSVDYEALAEECGEAAYLRALDLGHLPDVAEKFRQAFGKPIKPRLRLP